jgi:hypothetical protein
VTELLAFTIVGIVTGSIYAVAASGLVVTYTTSGVFNIAHGAIGMFMAFVYWQVRFDWGWPTPLALAFVLLFAAPLDGRPRVGGSTGSSRPGGSTWARSSSPGTRRPPCWWRPPWRSGSASSCSRPEWG